MHQYETWNDLLGYCRYSANPVGRLVLYVCGYRDAARQRLSDATCTALQLANFWQDVSRDLEKGRLYIPLEALRRHGLSPEDIEARRFDERYVALMKDLIARTRALFAEGAPLQRTRGCAVARGPGPVRARRTGRAGGDRAAGLQHPCTGARPSVRCTRASLLARAVSATARGNHCAGCAGRCARVRCARRLLPRRPAAGRDTAAIEASYAECRRVARRAASNFYYAFYMLPRAKRDALCALYAFMRLVDDVSDADGSTARYAGDPGSAGGRRWRAGAIFSIRPWPGQTTPASDPAGVCRHGAALSDSAALFPRSDFRRGDGSDRNALCHVRSPAGVLLPRRGHRGTDLPARLRLGRSSCAGTGRAAGHRLSVDQYPARCQRRSGARTRFICRKKTWRDLGARRKIWRAAWSRPPCANCCACRPNAPGVSMAEGAPLLGRIHPDSRAALWALIRIYSSLLARIEERDFDVFSGARAADHGGENRHPVARAPGMLVGDGCPRRA